MHLQQHPRGELLRVERVLHPRHGAADDVGGGALDRCVDGLAFHARPLGRIVRADLRIVADAPEQGRDVALLAARALGGVDVVANAGKPLEILLDEGGRLLAADAEAVGQTEGRDAVDDTEIDGLGAPPEVAGHLVERHAEHRGGGRRVNVESLLERFAQLRDVGDVGEQAQLDLAVIRRDQLLARRRHEGAADAPPFLGADRNVLQVRVRGGEPARGRRGEREGGVDAVRAAVGMLLQRIGVGRFQLGELAPVQDLLRQVVSGLCQLFEQRRGRGPLARRRLLGAWQAHLAEQHVADLLRR